MVCLICGLVVIAASLRDPEPANENAPVRFGWGRPGGHTVSLAVRGDGLRIATADTFGRVALWDGNAGGKLERTLDSRSFVASVAFSPDGRLLAAGQFRAGVTLWNLGFYGPVPIAPCPLHGTTFVTFAPDGRTLAAASDANAEIALLDLQRPSEWSILWGRSPHVCLAYSRDGLYLAAGEARDRLAAVCLWDLATGKQKLVLEGSPGTVVSIAFLAGSNLLASCAYHERGARLWELGTGRLRLKTAGHAMGTNAVAISPDQNTLATVGNDGKVRLWDVNSGRQCAVLDGQAARLNQVAFTADGQVLVASASNDNDLRFWSLTEQMDR
jgi:WD40 repeat protein